jgi:hypothetical protein
MSFTLSLESESVVLPLGLGQPQISPSWSVLCITTIITET